MSCNKISLALKKADYILHLLVVCCLASKSVQCAALSLQCVDDIHCCDSFPLSMFSVGNSISNDVFEEHFQNTSSFLVDKTGNSFHTSTTGQSTNCWLGNTLDVVT